jgi:hypothetical protein
MLKTVTFPSIRTGNQTILDGNLVIGTAGKGIDFSADPSAPGMTSELLDDYEEGTWTPVLEGTTTNPTVTYNAANRGVYTKIGNVVTVTFNLYTTTKTGGSGAIVIAGLPFACAEGGIDIGPGWTYNLNLSPIGSLAVRLSGANSTKMRLEVMRDDDLPLSLPLTDWPDAVIGLCRSTLTYRVA